jgi:hypothetical protein
VDFGCAELKFFYNLKALEYIEHIVEVIFLFIFGRVIPFQKCLYDSLNFFNITLQQWYPAGSRQLFSVK